MNDVRWLIIDEIYKIDDSKLRYKTCRFMNVLEKRIWKTENMKICHKIVLINKKYYNKYQPEKIYNIYVKFINDQYHNITYNKILIFDYKFRLLNYSIKDFFNGFKLHRDNIDTGDIYLNFLFLFMDEYQYIDDRDFLRGSCSYRENIISKFKIIVDNFFKSQKLIYDKYQGDNLNSFFNEYLDTYYQFDEKESDILEHCVSNNIISYYNHIKHNDKDIIIRLLQDYNLDYEFNPSDEEIIKLSELIKYDLGTV